MAIWLKKDIIVITDSIVGSVFVHQFPHQPPPIRKMKGGVLHLKNVNSVPMSHRLRYKIALLLYTMVGIFITMTQLNVCRS